MCPPDKMNALSINHQSKFWGHSYLSQSHCVTTLLCPISKRLRQRRTISIPTCTRPIIVYKSSCVPFPWFRQKDTTSVPTSPIIVYRSCCVPSPWGWDTEGQPLSLLLPVPLLCTSPVVFYFPEVGTQGQPLSLSVPVPLLCTSPIVFHFHEVGTQRDNLYP